MYILVERGLQWIIINIDVASYQKSVSDKFCRGISKINSFCSYNSLSRSKTT